MSAEPNRKRSVKTGTEARNVTINVRKLVLHEAGYKCSNPRCRYPLTLDVHHLYYVSESGKDDPANLLPLCPTCHQEHHRGRIPTESLRAWKVLLLAINEAFDRRSVDVLIALHRLEHIKRLSGDGVLQLAPLVASGLVNVKKYEDIYKTVKFTRAYNYAFSAKLTDKGRLFVEGWLKGDQDAAIPSPIP